MQIPGSNLVERLHSLVQHLTSEEKSQFSSSIVPANRKSQYVRLYKILLQEKEVSRPKIQKKLGLKTKGLSSIATYLEEALITSLVKVDVEGHLALAVAKKAREKGFLDFAQRTLEREIAKQLEKEELAYLLELYEEMHLLENGYRHKLKWHSDWPTYRELLGEVGRYARSRELFQVLEARKRLAGAEKLALVEQYRGEIKSVLEAGETRFVKVKFWVWKLAYMQARFEGDISLAEVAHEKAFSLVRGNEYFFSQADHLSEGFVRVHLLIELGKDFLARSILEDIVSLEVEPSLEPIQMDFWITTSMRLCLNLRDIAVGERTIADFEQNIHLFKKSLKKGVLYHVASLIHFVNENWNQVIRYQNKSSVAMKNAEKLNTWSNHAIKAIANLELGNYSEAKRSLTSLKAAKEFDSLAYVRAIWSLIHKSLGRDLRESDSQALLKQAYQEIQSILQSPGEQYATHHFNVLPWLEAKLESENLMTYLEKNPHLHLMRAG